MRIANHFLIDIVLHFNNQFQQKLVLKNEEVIDELENFFLKLKGKNDLALERKKDGEVK